MRHCILVVGFLFSLSVQAATEKYECKISQRLDVSSTGISTYEDVNDFTFEEYSWLLMESVDGAWQVSIGAMSYDEAITQSFNGLTGIFSYDHPDGDNKWQIRFNSESGVATFIAQDDEGVFTDTAEFTCQ